MDRDVYRRMGDIETTHWWFTARRRILATVLNDLVPAGGRPDLLEAGCGSGGNLTMLRGFGDVRAFEYDPFARNLAVARSGLDILPGALPGQVPFGDRRFDIICLFDVLEHVEQDTASLAALASRLKEGGVLFLTVPAFPALWSHHDVAHHHHRRYTRRSLAEAAAAAGLTTERSFYFNSLLAPLAVGVRLLKSLLGRQTPEDTLPPAPVNRIFEAIFSSERHLLGRVPMPFGLSLGAVLRPKERS